MAKKPVMFPLQRGTPKIHLATQALRDKAAWLEQHPELLNKYLPRMNEYFPYLPHVKQAAMLLWNGREAFYGGAAGGGKSDYLLMAAVQFVDQKGYEALLIRRTWGDLNAQGGLIRRSKEWWSNTKAEWSETHRTWTFPPHGATIKFMHMEHPEDRHKLRGIQVQFIGYDEVTEFNREMFLYAYRSLRKAPESEIPLRLRACSNPGGIGHNWVKQRYINNWDRIEQAKRDGNILVMLSSFEDNPGIDHDTYREGLKLLPPLERKRQLEGDWDASESGQIFMRKWFEPLVDVVPNNLAWLRTWDLAAQRSKNPDSDSDYAAGVLQGVDAEGIVWVADLVHFRGTALEVEQRVRQTAERDTINVPIFIEQEPGAAGLALMEHYERQVLRGFNFTHERSTGDVGVRAVPWAGYAENGHVRVLDRDWSERFLAEHETFNGKAGHGHDDIVSACTHGFARLYTPQDHLITSIYGDDDYTEESIERMLTIE